MRACAHCPAGHSAAPSPPPANSRQARSLRHASAMLGITCETLDTFGIPVGAPAFAQATAEPHLHVGSQPQAGQGGPCRQVVPAHLPDHPAGQRAERGRQLSELRRPNRAHRPQRHVHHARLAAALHEFLQQTSARPLHWDFDIVLPAGSNLCKAVPKLSCLQAPALSIALCHPQTTLSRSVGGAQRHARPMLPDHVLPLPPVLYSFKLQRALPEKAGRKAGHPPAGRAAAPWAAPA